MAAISSIEHILGSLTINARGMSSLSLPNLQTIGGSLYLSNNTFTSFELDALSSIGLDLSVSYNDNLEDFSGFGSFSSIGGSFSVIGNPILSTFDGIGPITTLDIVNIRGPIDSIAAFSNLTSIGSLYLAETNLVDLTGLDSVTDIDLSMFISQNEYLESTAGLSAIERVGENFSITQNPALFELTLDSLTDVGGFFHLWENTILCSETVSDLFDNTAVGNGTTQWGNSGVCPE